jgi:general secretion pathway protein K
MNTNTTQKEGIARSGSQRGSALIAVFWLMAILSLAVFSTVYVVSSDVAVVVSQRKAFRAMQLAEMGVALASNPAIEEFDPLLHQVFDSGESFDARIRSESGWLNINRLVMEGGDALLLEELFERWGMEKEDAVFVVRALQDWVDADEVNKFDGYNDGAENEYYTEHGFENYPFDRPFYDLEEVILVRGMDVVASYQPNWRNYFTIYSEGQLDVNEASAELIAAAAGTDVNSVTDVVRLRDGADELPDTEDDEPFQSVDAALSLIEGDGVTEDPQLISSRFTTQSNTVRIESIGRVGNYQRKLTVIVRNRESRPTILSIEESPVE